jgi:hypothetical protein
MVYRDTEVLYGAVLLMHAGCSVVESDWEWLDKYFVAFREALMEVAARIGEGQ